MKATLIVLLIIAAITTIFGLFSWFMLTGIDDWATRGQLGDMYGAVNALFAALAFSGFLLALKLQRDELRLQRQELKQSREQMKRSADAQEKSQSLLAAQSEIQIRSAEISALTTMINILQSRIGKTHRPNPEDIAHLAELETQLREVYSGLRREKTDWLDTIKQFATFLLELGPSAPEDNEQK